MPSAKILNYESWRKHLENKDFSDVLKESDQSFYDHSLKSGGWLGGNATIDQLLGKKKGILSMVKKQDEHEFKRVVNDLKNMSEKESVFRKDKVEKLKQLIKNKQYFVPGRLVVEKWFPE